jgi:hypothetical protein
MSANLAAILITALVAFVLGAAGMRMLWQDHAGLEHRLTVVETEQAAEKERRTQLENIKTWKHYSYNQRAASQDGQRSRGRQAEHSPGHPGDAL